MAEASFNSGYALLIGVGADLSTTVRDATALRDLLIDSSRCAYPPDQVELITETGATRAEVLSALDRLEARVADDPQATAIVYFSGHGVETPDYYLLPYNYDLGDLPTTCLSGAEFTRRLKALKAQKLLVLLDACHAGGLAEVKGLPGITKSPAPPDLLETLSVGSGRVVIASSRKDQKSLILPGASYSAFTQALLEGLAGQGAAELDGYARVADVAMYVSRVVSSRTDDRQHPILKLNKADNFALAYYAGGEKSPRPLRSQEMPYVSPIAAVDSEVARGYQGVLKKLRENLLTVEEQMAEFFDEAAIPLDLKRTKAGILRRIAETQEKIKQSAGLHSDTTATSKTTTTQPARIFVSYKRNVEPDEPLALRLYEALREHHDVFIDQTMLVGTAWAERIQAELETCDYLIPLISEHSVHSEMVEAEIRAAHRLGKTSAGKPRILPVRVAYTEPLEYPLSAYLGHLSWAIWQSEADTEPLIKELLAAIAGGELSIAGGAVKLETVRATESADLPRPRPSADPIRLELPSGTMDAESKFYIERKGDALCQTDIARQGVTITIKAPRQLGKSSLLVRTMEHAAAAGKAVAFLDFQLLDCETLESPEAFFRTLCHWITDELDLADEVDHSWEARLGHVQRCTRYFRRHVLHEVDNSLVLAMDEVDRMFDCPFRSDFFGMLRSWHNSRRPSNEWKRLDLALVISTEPYLLIDDLNQSPFNVGQVIELDDFTPDQVRDLNASHGHPLSEAELNRLMVLIGGHPYLVRRALYLIASGQMDAETLLTNAARDDGPFGDHLRRHLFRFRDKPDLRQAMAQIVAHNTCSDDLLFFRLRGAGLARRAGSTVVPRYGLYATYFRERFNV